jgi:hypothetical protein
VIDFTDSANPVEIAWFDRGPIHPEELVTGGFWSTYYYEGHIYGTEIIRGLDVLRLLPSEFLSEAEIAAAALAEHRAAGGRVFNPQQQYPVAWPHEPIVARAYLDQLLRDDALDADTFRALDMALHEAEDAVQAGTADRDLARQLAGLAEALEGFDADGASARRIAGLGGTLAGIAERLENGARVGP